MRQGAPVVRQLHPVGSVLSRGRAPHGLSEPAADLPPPQPSKGAECHYVDLSQHGRASLFTAVNSAKDVHILAFRTVLDMFGNQERVDQAVSAYFSGVNTWSAVVEQATFEKQLAALWKNPSAETCALLLSMSLIARGPEPTPRPGREHARGLGDSAYHTSKTVLNLALSSLPMTVPLLQAEFLVAMYEFAHSMPQQAYLSLGSCLQMTRVLGWHNRLFWGDDRQKSVPRELKLCSVLWWAIVHVDW